jgi:hypothetical protein
MPALQLTPLFFSSRVCLPRSVSSFAFVFVPLLMFFFLLFCLFECCEPTRREQIQLETVNKKGHFFSFVAPNEVTPLTDTHLIPVFAPKREPLLCVFAYRYLSFQRGVSSTDVTPEIPRLYDCPLPFGAYVLKERHLTGIKHGGGGQRKGEVGMLLTK